MLCIVSPLNLPPLTLPTHPPSLQQESIVEGGGHASRHPARDLEGYCCLTHSSSAELPLHQELSWTTFDFISRLYRQPQRSLVTSAYPVRHGPARLLLRGSIIFVCFFASSFELPRPKTPHRHLLLQHLLPVVSSSNGNLFLLLSFSSILLDRGLATQPSSWLLACCFSRHFLWWASIAQWFTLSFCIFKRKDQYVDPLGTHNLLDL